KLIALQNEFLIPYMAAAAECNSDALPATLPQDRAFSRFRPRREPRQHSGFNNRRGTGSMGFPGEKRGTAAPADVAVARCRLLAGKAWVADRDDSCAGEGAVAVGKGIELFDIAQRMPCLTFDPGSEPRLQRAVRNFKRTGRKGRAVFYGQDS